MTVQTGLICGISLAVLVAGVLYLIKKYRQRWRLVNVGGEFTTEHHLPDEIPVPHGQAMRVKGGEFTFDEVVGWMGLFLKRHKHHRRRHEYELVLRKYELYKELSEKMGRGLWRDVDVIGQRLAEVDPLDPSGVIARGRAMRELGNYPVAIRFYQKALELTPFHSDAFPEMAATCRVIGQPGRFRKALDKARHELGDTHPLTIEGRIQLGELVRFYADPTDPATIAHIPREQYLLNVRNHLEEMNFDNETALQIGQAMLADDMPELAENVVERCEREFGSCAEVRLLRGMIEHYRLNLEAAEGLVRKAIEQDDFPLARLELGKILLERSRRATEAQKSRNLEIQGYRELRLAVDRNPNMVDAISLLVERGWNKGLAGVIEELSPLQKEYGAVTWGVWKVLGDAYMAEDDYDNAIQSYQKGMAIETSADSLLQAYLAALEQVNRRADMLAVALKIKNIDDRDPALRWKVAQVLCEHQKLVPARHILQNLVDDDHVTPYLRQQADDVLDHLDEIERQQFKRARQNKSKS